MWTSKKVFIAIGIVAILVIVFGRIYGIESTGIATGIPSSKETSAALVAIADQSLVGDTDNDGLPDWEEILRKTDVNNPDSDGDGIEDSKEIFEDSTIDSRVKKVVEELDEKGLTATERFGRELLVQYLATKKEGGVFDAGSTAQFVEKMTREINQEVPMVLFTSSDVQAVGSNSIALREYANRMGRIFIRNTPPGLENELVVVSRALESKNAEELKKLQPLIESFTNSIAEGLTVPVPKELVQLHLDLLNSFLYMKTTLSGLELIFDDPLTAFIRITQHQESMKKLQGALQKIGAFYEEANIEFEPEDDGNALIHF